MLKPLTFSLSLALALGLCSVSMAGGQDDNCTTCGLASPQGGPYATGQGGVAGCEPNPCCPPKKHCFKICLPKCHLPKIHCPKIVHTCKYEWVLKKKHCFSIQHCDKNDGCGAGGVYASGQGGVAPSGQVSAAPSGQYGVYGAGQHAFQGAKPATSIAAAPAEMTPAIVGGEEAPPAPEVSPNRGSGLLLPSPAGN
jgi:hypothetical protein